MRRMVGGAGSRLEARGSRFAVRGSQKLRVPRWCWVDSSRPVACVRPLLDLLSLLPLRAAARDLCSGSGLTANRTNLPYASELYLAFNWASRSPRPALCYRPLLAFPRHFAMLRVTQLEPRTPHQPEKLKKLSKNDSVVLLLIFESMKTVRFYLFYFQWSAGGPQEGDRILCRRTKRFRPQGRWGAGFRGAGCGRCRD
jgi:hypothetical protein